MEKAAPDSASSRLAARIAEERAGTRLPPVLEAMRPRQWSKNVFVLAGIVFAGRLFDAAAWVRVLGAFGAFCAAASAVYLANDVADRAYDAHHPVKRHRAIASGRLSAQTAIAAAAILAAIAVVAAAALNGATLALLGAYLLSSFAYSVVLKRVFLLDVLVVAGGFVLRAAAGAAAIDAEISPWLLVCSFLLAVFLALGKRRSELVLLGDEAASHRSALGDYSLPLVDGWLTALSGATIVSYAIYTQAPRTVEHFGTTHLVFTVPFVIYALFRYQYLVVRQQLGGDPGTVLMRDKALWVALAGWALAAAAVIYR